MQFDMTDKYDEESYVHLYSDASNYPQEFRSFVMEKINKTEVPNIEVGEVNVTSGGIFFNKETTPMVYMAYTKSELKALSVWFRAQRFGNLVVFSMFKCLDQGFFETISGQTKEQKMNTIKSSFKNLANWEEFTCLDALGDMIFSNVKENFNMD